MDNGAKHFEHYATAVYSRDSRSRSKEIAIPVWVFQAAKKICETHEELAKKAKDVTDNATFHKKTQEQLQFQNTELSEKICQLEKVLKNQLDIIISTAPDKNVHCTQAMRKPFNTKMIMRVCVRWHHSTPKATVNLMKLCYLMLK